MGVGREGGWGCTERNSRQDGDCGRETGQHSEREVWG